MAFDDPTELVTDLELAALRLEGAQPARGRPRTREVVLNS